MIFNPVLLLLDGIVLRIMFRYRKLWVCWAMGFLLCAAGIFLGFAEARGSFHFARMAASGIFLHVPLLLFGTGAIWWKLRRKMALGFISCAVLLLGIGGYAFLIEPFWLEITHYEITSPKIERPLRIVVIADIQFEQFGEYEERVLQETLAQKPDLILLAGDYIQCSSANRLQQMQSFNGYLRQIDFSARLGVFAIQGNVDGEDMPNSFNHTEITAARFRQEFDLDELLLTCLSLRDSFSPQTAVGNSDPKKFHIVLGHSPNFALGRIDADLLVAGHTHGGQVRLPFFGPLMTKAAVPRRWAAGMTELPGGGKLLVSRGIGMERGDAPQLRFCSRPELAVIDLAPAK